MFYNLLICAFIVSSNRLKPNALFVETPSATFPSISVSETDNQHIKTQLGYIPANLVSVSARSSIGKPIALKTYALNGGADRRKAKALNEFTPFPTLYWLCCPNIGNAIANLEGQGYIGILEERLLGDLDLAKGFIQCHKGYAEERWSSLTADHQNWVSQHPSAKIERYVRYSGIAGTNYNDFILSNGDVDKISIKCLHTHYAHYRSQLENNDYDYPLNIIGQWTHELLQKDDIKVIL